MDTPDFDKLEKAGHDFIAMLFDPSRFTLYESLILIRTMQKTLTEVVRQLLPELEQQSPVPREARNVEKTETGCAMQPSRLV